MYQKLQEKLYVHTEGLDRFLFTCMITEYIWLEETSKIL